MQNNLLNSGLYIIIFLYKAASQNCLKILTLEILSLFTYFPGYSDASPFINCIITCETIYFMLYVFLVCLDCQFLSSHCEKLLLIE